MLFKFKPGKPLQGVLIKKLHYQIVEFWAKSLNWRYIRILDHLNQNLEATCVKWGLTSRNLVKYTSQRPKIRSKRLHSIILEQFWSHIVWGSMLRSFLLRVYFFIVDSQVRNFLRQSKITVLKIAVLVKKYV